MKEARNSGWKRARVLMRQLGWATSALYICNSLLTRFNPNISLERYYLVVQPIPETALLRRDRRRSITVKLVEKGDPHLLQVNRPPDEILKRFQNGAVCLMALRDDRCVGYMWLMMGRYEEPRHRCRIFPLPIGKVAWDLDLFIAPEERGGLLFAQLWDAANAHLRSANVSWTFSRVSAFNRQSIAAHRRLGMRVLQSITFVSVGSFQLMVSMHRPWVHVSFTQRSMPSIKISAVTD